jgi:DedD protein
MDDRLKKRLVGAAVLVLAAVIFVPIMLDQGGESPLPAARMVPAEPLDGSAARVVPLAPMRAEPDPVPSAPAVRMQEAPAVEKPAAKPVAAPKPAKPALKPAYAVQLGSFAKAANANGLRDKLVAKGYKAFVKRAGSATKVYVGPQATRAEADKALQALLADIKLKGLVVPFPG